MTRGDLKMYENKKGYAIGVFGLVLLVAIGLLIGYIMPKTGMLAAVPSASGVPQPASPVVCSSTTSPQVLWSAFDELSGNSISGTVNYKINDGAVAATSTNTAVTTVKVGDKVDYIVGGDGTQYNKSSSYLVECVQSKQINVPMLRMSTSPTLTVFDDDGSSINSVTLPQVMGANDERTVTYSVQPEARRGLQGLYLIQEYNGSVFRAPLSTKRQIDTPGYYTVNDTSHKTTSFYIADELKNSDIHKFTTTLRSTGNPGTTDVVHTCVKDSSWFIDELDNREFRYGANDENQVILGQTCAGARSRSIAIS